MFKRFLAFALAIAMTVALWMIPASAATLTKVFSADYRSASNCADRTGNLNLQNQQGSAISSILYAQEGGTYYATSGSMNNGAYRYMYQDGNYQALNSVYTMEAYVCLSEVVQSNTIELFMGGDSPFVKLFWSDGYFGFGYTDNSAAVTGRQKTILQTFGWYHIVVTNDGSVCTLYVNGQAVGTSASIRVDGLWYFYLAHTAIDGYGIALYNVYNTAATASQVAALYTNCGGTLATPTVAPTAKPTAAPTPQPGQTVDAYKVVAENVPVFTAGDTVEIKFSITDIKATGGLCGLDLTMEYNTDLLSPNMVYSTEMSGDVLSISSSSIALNLTSGNADCDWWATGKISAKSTDNPVLILTMLEDNGNYAVSEDGAIWISVSFTAIADSTAGDLLVDVVKARGTDSRLTQVEGIGASASAFEVIHEKEEKSLGISQKPTKLTYNIGETLDLSGMVVSVSVNGAIQTVDVNQCVVDGFDSTEAGTCVITVTYETDDAIYKNQFAVKIVDAKGILAIGISVKPTKLRYALGDELDLTGLVVRARCNDGTTIYPDIGDLSVSGYDPTALGVQKVMLTYGGRSNSFSIKVTEYPIPIGIKLISKPSKLVYSMGEDLDTAGLSVMAVYSDGTTETLGAEDVTVRGYRNYIIGKQSVTVEYRTVTYSFTVRVDGDFSVYKVTLETKPSKLIYSVGEELDLTGLSVKVWYNDDTSVILGPEDLEVSGYDASTTGVQRLTVSYQGCSNSFSVRVN